MKKVFISQPTFLPWLGIFYAISKVDEYVFWDDVQYERKSWQNRNRIRNINGGEILINVPVKSAPREARINEIQLSDDVFYRKILKQIALNYAKEPHTKEVIAFLQEEFQCLVRFGKLMDLNEGLIIAISKYLGLTCDFKRSMDLGVAGDKQTRPTKVAKYLQATDYLTQIGTKDYFNQEAFDEAGIKVHWLDINPPNKYSIVDYLCRLSKEEIRDLL